MAREKYRLTNHAVSQFKRRFYFIARKSDNVVGTIHSLLRKGELKRLSKRKGDYCDCIAVINGSFVAFVAKDRVNGKAVYVVKTIVRDYGSNPK